VAAVVEVEEEVVAAAVEVGEEVVVAAVEVLEAVAAEVRAAAEVAWAPPQESNRVGHQSQRLRLRQYRLLTPHGFCHPKRPHLLPRQPLPKQHQRWRL